MRSVLRSIISSKWTIHPRQLAVARTIPPTVSIQPPQTVDRGNPSRFLSSNSSGDKSSTLEEFRRKQEQIEEEFNKNTPVEPIRQSTSRQQENEEDEHTTKIRKEILSAAMTFVPTLGWTKECITKGAESLGYPGTVHGMFPRGSAELVEFFYTDCTKQLVDWMEKETEGGTKVASGKAFVTKAVEQRLRMLVPYLSSWPQAIAVMSLPQNAVNSLANVLALVDEICYYSGDKAVDFAWYTRRVGLAGIYKVTELYMLQDKSPDYVDTFKFLERRMDEAVMINKVLESSDEVTANFQNAVGAVFTTARNIIGLNFNRR